MLLWDSSIVEWYFRRADTPQTDRGDAAGRDVDIPWRRVAATPRLRRGYSVETGARVRYYPALTTGETHVAVNRSTAIPVLDRLEGDMKEVAKLVAGAQRVHGQHMCARCIAQYWRDVFAAIRARVRYDLVLDDKTKVLAVVEAEGACDVYHEVAVSFPADDKHNYHGSIAYYKNHKPTVSRGVGLCDWLRRERKQEKVRVVR